MLCWVIVIHMRDSILDPSYTDMFNFQKSIELYTYVLWTFLYFSTLIKI